MNKANWKPLTTLTASLLLAACGGGGGGGSDSAAPGPAPANPGGSPVTPTTPTGKTVTGAVTKGPVSGATVQLFAVDQFGNAVGSSLGTAETDANGNFSIPNVDPAAGDLLVVASDGEFLDESDQDGQRRIVLGPSDTFLSVLPENFSSVAITPFTTAAVIRGRVLAGPDGTFSEKFTASVTALSEQAGFDILSTIPANPTAPAADASDAAKQYALLLGGLANLINNVAVQSNVPTPTYDMVVAVTFDLVDGQFDGQYFGSTQVPGSTAAPVTLPQNISFSEEVNRFRNNNFSAYSDVQSLPSIEVASFANNFPVANAGANASFDQTALVTLNGTASSDPDGTGVFYNWTQIDNGATTVTLSNDSVASPTFTAPARLIDNETLSFQLTVIDPAGFTSVDTVDIEVVGALTSDFYVTGVSEVGDGIGTDVDGGGRITLTSGTTEGSLFTDEGRVPFDYTNTDTALTITFRTPFLQDDFDEERDINGDGVLDGPFLIEERVLTYTFTLDPANPNGDVVIITQTGDEVILPLNTPGGAEQGRSPLNLDPEPLAVYDIAARQPFSIATGDKRTLLFNSFKTLDTLNNNDELYHELFEFTSATRGITRDSQVGFDYEVNTDGNLLVTFDQANPALERETATYINLFTRPTGDVVATEYRLAEPFFVGESRDISDVRLSIPKNQSAAEPVQRSDVAGVYSGIYEPNSDKLDSGLLYLRLNPDGTGSVNFDFPASESPFFDFDNAFAFRSNRGVCWDVVDNEIVVDRAFSLNEFPNSFSSETSTTFCSNLSQDDVDFQFKLTQLDTNGTTFKYFDRVSDNTCAFIPTSDCAVAPELKVSNFQLRIVEREVLNDVPPVAFIDAIQTPEATPITVDPSSNDQARQLDTANPSTIVGYQINRGPFQGTITETIVPGELRTGPITYTPNAGIRSDVIEYQSVDSKGNKSQIQIIQIDINPCATINGTQGFFDVFTGDCDYGTPSPLLAGELNLGPVPGVHRFRGSLVIGQDFSTDATNGGITAGGQGPKLNIAAGTTLTFDNPGAFLSVSRGAQLNVGGTQTDPVIMTSQLDIDDQRDRENGGPGFYAYNAAGDWGGVIIQGFGRVNTCSYNGTAAANDLTLNSECHFPTPTGLGHFGGNNNADNSGSISHLVIKHAGADLAPDEEGIAFALLGVGEGTSISNVQVYASLGDGVGLIGGAVKIQKLVSQYPRIAGILSDLGYTGEVSNALLIQDRDTGEFCIDAAGTDDETLNSSQIDALITQGIISAPKFSNLTCVVSSEGIPNGIGIDFFAGSQGALINSIAVLPGQDFGFSECISANEQSKQALLDGNLFISSNLFACPTINNDLLPDSTPLGSFLTGTNSVMANNLFATLSPGIANPPPTATAATGNILLEAPPVGAPLIYAPDVSALSVNSATPASQSVTPQGTLNYFGAVQLTDDWTADWTFGLHPENREAPLWYEVPIVVAPRFIPASKGSSVFLDASQSVSQNSPLTFQWTQVNGDPVALSSTTGASISFTAPGAGTNLTQPGGFVQVELLVDDGVDQVSQIIDVVVDPSIPADFYSASESVIPLQFNRVVEGGARITIDPANQSIGNYKVGVLDVPFTWTDTATTFTIDFGGSPLVGPPITSFENIDGDVDQEEITRTETINSLTYTLISDNGPKKDFQLTKTGSNSITIVNNPVVTGVENDADEVFTNTILQNATQAVVGVSNGLFFQVQNGQVIALPANLGTTISTLTNPGILEQDLLTFFSDGTGSAKVKAETFTWTNDFGNLQVNFDTSGEIGDYVFMFDKNGSEVVGVSYVRSDSALVHQVSEAVSADNPFQSFSPSSVPSIPGIYKTRGRFEKNDGTFADEDLFYRLHPGGVGQLEFEVGNLVDGSVDFIAISGTGICWEVQPSGSLTWHRVQLQDSLYSGTPIKLPGPSDCSLVFAGDNTFTHRRRDLDLMRVFGNRYITYTESQENSDLSASAPPYSNLLEFSDTFIRTFEPVTFFIGNPPIAFPDSISASAGIAAPIDVLINDQDVDGDIDATSVTIVVPPKEGTTSIDPTTGVITYTPNSTHSGFDRIFYRVVDSSGNQSTVGIVDITVI